MEYPQQYIGSLLWGIVMLILLLMPSGSMDQAPSFPGFDKLAHTGTFFVLTTLLYREYIIKHQYSIKKWIAVVKVMVCTVIFAGMTELAQRYLSPSRTADLWDIFADVLGIALASFSFIFLFKKPTS